MTAARPSVSMPIRFGEDVLTWVDEQLADTDALLTSAYPGEDGGRQPVHTVYVPADRYTKDLPQQWGHQASAFVDEHGGIERLCAELGLPDDLAGQVAPKVTAKLDREPIEDLRLDFEDGYGTRPDEVEDADVVHVASDLAKAIAEGTAPAFVGLRFKCLEAPTRRRGLRTLDLFLSTLLEAGTLPDGLRITLPKVSTASQVEAMVDICAAYETAAGLTPGRLGFEIQVETPPLILSASGRAEIAVALHAGAGRVTSLHYGTYDYSASLGVSAAYQSMDHPVADYAKEVMQAAVAGTGVQLSDGSTNVLPIGTPDQVRDAWRLHHSLVRRSLERAYYQGWDMHFGHLPTRFVANFAFYREGFTPAAERLSAYLTKSGSGVLDEPATARALARYLHRGYSCGALDSAELIAAVPLTPDQLAQLSRPKSDTENIAIESRGTTPTPRERNPAETRRSDTVTTNYYAPTGGHPPQTDLLTDRAMFTEAYAVLPRGVMRDIVTSYLPFWENTRLWVIARPLSGFAETFSQYIVEVASAGGSERPELDPGAEGVLFVVEGGMRLTVGDDIHALEPGGYAYLPPGQRWTLSNDGSQPLRFHWIRKAYEIVDGLDVPEAFVTHERDALKIPMPGTDNRWVTTRFVDPADLGHDMHVNIVTFEPGAVIPFAETHVMEHGLYVLEGKAVYRLNTDWVEVQEGDFMWLRAFCPQACYAGGPGRFRYLLYKDVNRHMRLSRQFL